MTRNYICRPVEECSCGGTSRDFAEDRTVSEAGPTGVIEIEEAADELARGVEAGNRPLRGIEHPPVGVDAQAAKSERDAARRAIGLEGWLFDGHRPVGLVDR